MGLLCITEPTSKRKLYLSFMDIGTRLVIIVAAGLLGGAVNAVRASRSNGQWAKSLLKGVVAALLVPVFLEIIKSDLGSVANPDDPYYNYLVFAGLCLIAAIFSDKFIDSIGERILQKVEKAEKTAEESNRKVDIVIAHDAEPDEEDEAMAPFDAELAPRASRRSTSADKAQNKAEPESTNQIISCLRSGKYEYRTVGGIAKETGLNRNDVEQMLKRLEKEGSVVHLQTKNRTLWTLIR